LNTAYATGSPGWRYSNRNRRSTAA